MSLLIPIPPVQELSPEELEPLKDALLAHLRSQNATAREQVDRNLHVTRGERIPAYLFTFQGLLESREPISTTVFKPCPPEVAKDLPPPGSLPSESPKGSVDLWSFPSEERGDFTPHSGSYFIPGTIQTEDCRDCHQRGELGCKACMGKGEESCSVCLGAGCQSCIFCKGSEKVNCLRCGGEGRMASGDVGGRSASCDACGSTGKFKCTHCKAGKVTCAPCQGSGKAVCQKCKGPGKITCATCGGHKRNMSGKAFQASFRPFQVRTSSLAEIGPKEALAMALEKTADVGALLLVAVESLESQVKDATVPPAVRLALGELVEQEKSQASPTARVVKRRLDLAEGSVVRISGYCSGQEFSFWISPDTHRIVAEKDPLAAFGSTTASSAEEAREAGDWKKAVALAREALSYSPNQAGARHLLGSWRRKVVGEAILAGGVIGLLGAVGHVMWIDRFEKGLHKTGAMIHAGGLSLLLGPVTALVLLPILLKLYSSFLRRSVLLAGVFSVLIFSVALGRWSSNNSVRQADQAALDEELNARFKYGVPQVYYEPDLEFLQDLARKYKDSDVDLKRVNEAVAFQTALRAKLARQQEDFDAKARAILSMDAPVGRKRTLLTKLVNDYRLTGVDLSASEKALGTLPVEQKRGMSRPSAHASRMSITSGDGAKPARKVSGSGAKPDLISSKKKAPAKGAKGSPKKSDPKKETLKSGTSKRWWQ